MSDFNIFISTILLTIGFLLILLSFFIYLFCECLKYRKYKIKYKYELKFNNILYRCLTTDSEFNKKSKLNQYNQILYNYIASKNTSIFEIIDYDNKFESYLRNKIKILKEIDCIER